MLKRFLKRPKNYKKKMEKGGRREVMLKRFIKEKKKIENIKKEEKEEWHY